jgi:hypothetical protein
LLPGIESSSATTESKGSSFSRGDAILLIWFCTARPGIMQHYDARLRFRCRKKHACMALVRVIAWLVSQKLTH